MFKKRTDAYRMKYREKQGGTTVVTMRLFVKTTPW